MLIRLFVVYKGELVVGSQSVTVTAGATLNSNIHATFALEVSRI